jgi:hypothetical protein
MARKTGSCLCGATLLASGLIPKRTERRVHGTLAAGHEKMFVTYRLRINSRVSVEADSYLFGPTIYLQFNSRIARNKDSYLGEAKSYIQVWVHFPSALRDGQLFG